MRARNTARAYDPARWADGQERRDGLLRQSRWLADALEREGIRARETGDEAVDIDHVLGTVDIVERFRSLRFLPVVMQRDSAEQLAALRYFMTHHPLGTYARMAVVTCGSRVPAFGDLRDRHKMLKRALSRFASDARFLYGVEVFFTGVEYTRQQDEKSNATYHLHAHVLYSPTELMGEGVWVQFLAWAERFLRARMRGTTYAWTDCGRIREPDEACKYPFKPADLAQCGDKEIAWLQQQMHGMNLKQASGPLRSFRRELEENTRKTGEEVADEETGELAPVSVRAPLKVVALYPTEQQGKAELAIVHKRRRPQRGDRDMEREENPDDSTSKSLRENCILFTSNPTSSACPWATVKTRVVGYTETPMTRAGLEGLADLAMITDEVRRAWDANNGPPPLRIPLMMELEGARLISAAQEARRDVQEARGRARILNRIAARLRDALDPVAAQASPYGVHTCSLTVPDFGGGEATGVAPFHGPTPRPPPRSDFEVLARVSAASSKTPSDLPVADTRPWHTRAHLDADALVRAPLRVCRAVADYEVWWTENRARLMSK